MPMGVGPYHANAGGTIPCQWGASFPTRSCSYDADGDGIVDAEEFIAGAAATKDFKQGDINHDGKLSRQEWTAKFGNDEMFDA